MTRSAVGNAGQLAARNLLALRRSPGSLVAAVVQPVLFVLLIGYAFGSSLGGADYREFMMAGVFVQTVTFNSAFTATGLADDLQRGIVDRFRALPISRSSVLLGRTASDLCVSTLSLTVAAICGLMIGWRVRTGPAEFLGAAALLVFYAFSAACVGAYIGLAARNVELAQSVGMLWLFPVTLLSSAFVSTEKMPRILAQFAEWNPVSAVVLAVRKLLGNATPAGIGHSQSWPANNSIIYALLCSGVVSVFFMMAAIRRYKKIGAP